MAQQGYCVWFTGLSGAGKSTLATQLQNELGQAGCHVCILDGDDIREGLNRDLGFSIEDRAESVRRVGEVARLMVNAGLVTIVALISPFRADRQAVRQRFRNGNFIEVFVDTSLSVCEARDPKGLYKRARAGQIPDFTGVSSAYEPPELPEIHIRHDPKAATPGIEQILAYLSSQGLYGKA